MQDREKSRPLALHDKPHASVAGSKARRARSNCENRTESRLEKRACARGAGFLLVRRTDLHAFVPWNIMDQID
jgi:hypothetical protein